MSEQSCSIHGQSPDDGDVSSFNGRTGAVVPLAADYDSFFLTQGEGDARYAQLGSALTQGSILFADAAGKIEDDNANLFYDDTNNRVHVGDRSGGAATGAFNAYGTVFLTPNGLIGDGVIIGSNAALDAGVALQVVGRASEKTAIFRANATTPGNVIEAQNSGGVVKFSADADGRMALNGVIDGVSIINASGALGHPSTAATIRGVRSAYMAPSTATTEASWFKGEVRTNATAFTLASGFVYFADTPAIGATSAVTTLVGFRGANQGAAGATNAYGVWMVGQTGAATLNVAGRFDSSTTCALWIDGNANGTAPNDGIMFGSSRDTVLYRQAANRLGTGAGDQFAAGSKIYPGTDAGALQTASGLFAGTGAPNNANGADGDIYFRSDGGALTTVYQRRAGAWVGVV
jgi:hypothetical protein